MKFTNLKLIILSTAISLLSLNLAKNSPRMQKKRAGIINPEKMQTTPSSMLDTMLKYQNLRHSSPLFATNEFEKSKIKTKIISLNSKSPEELKKKINGIEGIMNYCSNEIFYVSDSFSHNTREYWQSFKETYKRKTGDCEDAAIAAAVMLKHFNIKPYILILSNDSGGHATTIYKTDKGKYGSIGINNSDCQYPKKGLDSLINSINQKSWGADSSKWFDKYLILDPDFIPTDIENGNKNNKIDIRWSYFTKIKK